MSPNPVIIWGCIFAAILTIGAAIHNGPSDTEAARAEYCSMWEIWHADRRAGVPVDKRYGWPDQAGRYYAECEL